MCQYQEPSNIWFNSFFELFTNWRLGVISSLRWEMPLIDAGASPWCQMGTQETLWKPVEHWWWKQGLRFFSSIHLDCRPSGKKLSEHAWQYSTWFYRASVRTRLLNVTGTHTHKKIAISKIYTILQRKYITLASYSPKYPLGQCRGSNDMHPPDVFRKEIFENNHLLAVLFSCDPLIS